MAKAIYKGLAFPFKRSTTAFPAEAVDDDLIKQSLVQIIMTGVEERVMRPGFGTRAYAFIFENDNLVLQETIRTEVMAAIAKFERRVIVRSVDVASENEGEARAVVITINYVVIATGQEQLTAITIPAPQ